MESVEKLLRQIEALKGQLGRQKDENESLRKTVDAQKVQIEQYKTLTTGLAVALATIQKEKKAVLLESFRYVTECNEPLAKDLMRLVNQLARRMAGFARKVSRSRPERKTGGECIGNINSQDKNEAASNSEAGNNVEPKNDIESGNNVESKNDIESDNNVESGNNTESEINVESDNNVDEDGLDEEVALQSMPSRPNKAIALMMRTQVEVESEYHLSDEYLEELNKNAAPYVDEPAPTERGRKNNMDELAKLDECADRPISECPNCHTPLTALNPKTKEHIIADLGVLADTVKALRTSLTATRSGSVELGYHAYLCTKCGTIFTGRTENMDHPMVPGRTISVNSIIDIGYLQHLGLSINAAGKDFEKNAKLGSNTIGLAIFHLDYFVYQNVYLALKRRLQKQPVIGADETPFAIKQATGEGRMPLAGVVKICGMTYIIAIGTSERSEIRIEGYEVLPGRSGEDIAQALRGFEFVVLNTDGYQGYNKTLAEHAGAEHQMCLVHARRQILNDVFDTSVVQDYFKLPAKRRKAYLLEQFNQKSTLYLVLLVFRAISHLYGHERQITKLDADSPEIQGIREKEQALMDLIDKIIKKIAIGHAEEDGNKKWRSIRSGDPLGTSCAFWLNHTKELRVFLKPGNYLVCADNNVMERTIRPLAIIRNVSRFWTSLEYARATLARLSVLRTLEINGIDAVGWSRKICGKLYDHICAKLIAYHWEDEGELTTKVRIRAEAKPGETDTLAPALRKYRLSELVKDFPWDKYVDEMLEQGRLNRIASRKEATQPPVPKGS